jgi:hypothetical protein
LVNKERQVLSIWEWFRDGIAGCNVLPSDAVGAGDGQFAVLGGLAVLDPPIVLERFCPECDAETRFVIEFVFANGFFGSCIRCGDERVAAFERTNSEEE